jgi:hypothetical protein
LIARPLTVQALQQQDGGIAVGTETRKVSWERARLFPISGIGGADEQERRATSALLAVVESVREFGRAVTMPLGAPGGRLSAFIEVQFKEGDRRLRPDGAIRVEYGRRSWTALVEVKTGRNELVPDQVESYLELARRHKFDVLLTISNSSSLPPVSIRSRCPGRKHSCRGGTTCRGARSAPRR